METVKMSENAIFDKDLMCWTDGIEKYGKKHGLWSYFDIEKNLVKQVTYMLGRVKNEIFFIANTMPPDAKYLLDNELDCFSCRLEPSKDKYGRYENGVLKLWRKCLDGKKLLKDYIRALSSEQMINTWQKASWLLQNEMIYKNGEAIVDKRYDCFGNLLYEYIDEGYKKVDDKIVEKFDEKEQKRVKKLVSTKGKTPEQNYKEYLNLYLENPSSLKKKKKADEKAIQEVEQRLNISLPDELKQIYTNYANGVEYSDILELLGTKKILGVVDMFKFLRDGCCDNWCDTHIYDEKLGKIVKLNDEQKQKIEYLNKNYFCFAYQQTDGDFVAFVLNRSGKVCLINFEDDYGIHIYKEYFESLENSDFRDFSSLWTKYLDMQKRLVYYSIMDEESGEEYEEDIDKVLDEIQNFLEKR